MRQLESRSWLEAGSEDPVGTAVGQPVSVGIVLVGIVREAVLRSFYKLHLNHLDQMDGGEILANPG